MIMQTTCPHCLTINDNTVDPTDSGASPSEHDVSLCFTCYRLSWFEGGVLVIPPNDKYLKLVKEPEFRASLAAVALAPTSRSAMKLFEELMAIVKEGAL